MIWSQMKLADTVTVAQVFAFEYDETLDAPGNGKYILIPANIKGVSVTLGLDAASTGKVQASTSTIYDIKDDNAIWVDWDYGIVSSTSQDYMLPATAIRQVNLSGSTKLELRAQ
jgi:hypothetical protein